MRDIGRADLLKELAALQPILEREGVLHMQLFGSRARGDNRADSDVDVLIDVDPDRKFSLFDMAGVYGHIEDRIGLESSVVVRRYTPDDFIDRILPEAIPVF